MSQPGEITVLLQQADDGVPDADERLYRLVEHDLRAIAKRRKQAAAANVELSTTQLVDDAFLQLVGAQATVWHPGDRRKFFGYMSRKMQDRLVEATRRIKAQKRGGEANRLEPEAVDWAGVAQDSGDVFSISRRRSTSSRSSRLRMHFSFGCATFWVAHSRRLPPSASKPKRP